MGCQDTIKILTHFVSGSLSTRTFINNTPCLTCFCSATSPTVEDRVWNISFQMDVIDFNIPLIILKLSVLITHTFWYFLPLAILSNKSDKCNRLWHPQIRCSAYTVGRTIFSVVGSGMGQSYALGALSLCPAAHRRRSLSYAWLQWDILPYSIATPPESLTYCSNDSFLLPWASSTPSTSVLCNTFPPGFASP